MKSLLEIAEIYADKKGIGILMAIFLLLKNSHSHLQKERR